MEHNGRDNHSDNSTLHDAKVFLAGIAFACQMAALGLVASNSWVSQTSKKGILNKKVETRSESAFEPDAPTRATLLDLISTLRKGGGQLTTKLSSKQLDQLEVLLNYASISQAGPTVPDNQNTKGDALDGNLR